MFHIYIGKQSTLEAISSFLNCLFSISFFVLFSFIFCLTYSGCVDTKGRSNSDHLLPLDHERRLQQHGYCVLFLKLCSICLNFITQKQLQAICKQMAMAVLQINLIYRTRQKTCLYVDRMQQCTKEKKNHNSKL